jgi:hypothetical protein
MVLLKLLERRKNGSKSFYGNVLDARADALVITIDEAKKAW